MSCNITPLLNLKGCDEVKKQPIRLSLQFNTFGCNFNLRKYLVSLPKNKPTFDFGQLIILQIMQEKIDELKKKLTGNLYDDMDIHNEIYEIKKQMNPEIVSNPQQDQDECEACGS